jgi:hypothetical protein
MPDTQFYSHLSTQPAGANHLDLVTRYICQHRLAWTEPTTGKTMPILMVIQLGDLVQSADGAEAVAGPFAEWHRVSAAFENLDDCDPHVPYVVTSGNHELDDFNYFRPSIGYQTFFGPSRWVENGVACNSLADCDLDSGQYFLGAGDTIVARSRNNDVALPGPLTDHIGRHRAGIIRTPDGQRMLFLGLEQAFDFPPAFPGFEGIEGDDSAWPKQVLALYHDVPTVVFHHSMLWMFPPPDTRLRWGPETWASDSISPPAYYWEHPDFGTEGGMKDLYELLIEPYPQVKFLFTGHVYNPNHQADYTIDRSSGPVWAFLRNYQLIDQGLAGNADRYGVGWNVVAAFDPDAREVRVRSYRIDDVENYAVPPVSYAHVGAPAPTECLQTDQNGVAERVISWNFQVPMTTPGLSGAGLAGLAALVVAATVWSVGRLRARAK